MHTETKRVFVPNLPENVTEEEIRKRFFKYGDITSVEIKFRKEVNARNHSHQYVFVNIETTPKLLQQCFDEFAHKKWNGQWVEVQLAKESFLEKLRREREESQQANGYAETTETKSVEIKTNGKRNSTENLESPKKKIKQASSSSDSDSSSSSEDEKSKKKPVTKANQTITPKVTKKVKSAKSSSDSDSSSSSSEDDKSKKKPSVNTSQTNTTKTTKKGKTESSSSDSDSSSDDEKEKVKKNVDVPLDYVVKSNKHKKADNKIEGVGLAPIHVQTSVVKKKSKDPYREQADKKRVESMMNMRQGYMQQKSLIKNALSNVDNKQSTKITFNDDNEPIIEKSVESSSEKPQKKDKKSKKLSLFDGNDDEDDGKTSFKLRDEYEGKKGQKLFEMQQRFNQDDRFKLDARFAEDESNDDGDPQTEADQPVDELSMQMQVLGEVLKQPVVKHSEKGPRKSLLRFDPSQPEHSKYEMEDPRKDASSKTKKEKKKKKKNEVEEEVKLPEVSAETFYEVSTNIPFQESGEGEGFSLLKALGRDQDDEIYGDQNMNDQEMEESYNNEGGGVEKKKKKKVNGVQNAFKYDSSDDDDNKEDNKVCNDAEKKEDIQDGLQERKGQLFWSERFFFKRDDYRLQEGVDFVKRMHLTTGEDNFSQVRQGLKNLVHRKMSTVYKKSRPPPPKHKRLSKNAYNNQKRRRKAQTRTSRSNP